MKTILSLIILTFFFTSFSQQVRITQIYAGGGEPGSSWNQDFVEIFNSGTSAINISGWSVQYASATGSTWSGVNIPASTTLPGGSFYLIGLAAGANGNPLPTPDVTGSFDMDEAAGKVVLVNNSTLLSGTACSAASVVDIVGYGTTATCYEVAPVITTSMGGIDHTKSYDQRWGGCLNNNNNDMDFGVAYVGQPKNTAFGLRPCSQGPHLYLSNTSVYFMTPVDPGAYHEEVYSLFGMDLDNYPGNIVVTAPAGTEVSLTSGSGFASTINLPYTSSMLEHTQVYVRTPISTAGLVSGIITHVGSGTNIDMPLSGAVIETEPTTQTNNFVLSNFTDTTMDVSWAPGNGSSRIIIIRETAVTGINQPSDGRQYNANTDINLAPEVNSGNLGNLVVYSGSGSGPITVTGLLPGTNYELTGYEFNGSNGTNNYYTYTFNAANGTTTGSPAILLQRNFNCNRCPRYMGSGNTNRVPTVFQASINNLQPNTTYRYYTQASVTTDLKTYSTGSGDPLLIDYTTNPATYSYSTSPSLTTAGGYGKFMTNSNGTFTGDFGFIYTGDSRFTAGNEVFPSIALAVDGATDVERRYALSIGTTVLEFDAAAGANKGTYIKGSSYAIPGRILCLVNNYIGTDGRPLSMTLVESPGLINGSGAAQWGTNFIAGYDNSAGSWNTITPNDNPAGVQVILAFSSNIYIQPWVVCNTSLSGDWGPTANTSNPTGGTTALQVPAIAAPLVNASCYYIIPVRMSSFEVQKINTKVKLSWTTDQEINSKEFIVERSANGTNWFAIATIAAAVNSSSRINYTTTDNNPVKGINFYRIREVSLDNKFDYSATKSVLFNAAYEVLVTPNPARDMLNIYIDNNSKTVTILLVDASGKVIRKLDSNQPHVQINTAALARGMYYVKVMNETDVSVSKVLLQ